MKSKTSCRYHNICGTPLQCKECKGYEQKNVDGCDFCGELTYTESRIDPVTDDIKRICLDCYRLRTVEYKEMTGKEFI